MKLSPIALFTYNRPDHLKETLKNLAMNQLAKESELIIFVDGPKNDGDKAKQQEIENHFEIYKNEFKSCLIKKSKVNQGLAKSIMSGIDDVFVENDTIIVLEDDIATSRSFLEYMNTNLKLYKDDENVASIHGYVYPLDSTFNQPFFLRGADCWGWGTWKRTWNTFNTNGEVLLNELKIRKLTSEFDYNDSFPFTKMLEDQVNGKNNSWAIRWYASCFLRNMYTLYPGSSLVKNIGLDGSGTHCSPTDIYDVEMLSHVLKNSKIPIIENQFARAAFSRFFKESRKKSLKQKLLNKLKRLFK